MPHIHTNPGEIDRTADVFIVHPKTKRLLLRFHDKLKMWLVPGGHIENNQTAPEAALAEAMEEVGLAVTLWKGNQMFEHTDERYTEIVPPVALNVHFITPEHRHESHVYFGTSESDIVVEPDNHERTDQCVWMTKQELLDHPDVHPTIKLYGAKALEILAP